jgi:hypothetical protein
MWKNHIKIILRGLGRDGMGLVHLAQDRDQWWTLVNKIMKLLVP